MCSIIGLPGSCSLCYLFICLFVYSLHFITGIHRQLVANTIISSLQLTTKQQCCELGRLGFAGREGRTIGLTRIVL